jgi:hypothetical protein
MMGLRAEEARLEALRDGFRGLVLPAPGQLP